MSQRKGHLLISNVFVYMISKKIIIFAYLYLTLSSILNMKKCISVFAVLAMLFACTPGENNPSGGGKDKTVHFWSSFLIKSKPFGAYRLWFKDENPQACDDVNQARYFGMSIRLVLP